MRKKILNNEYGRKPYVGKSHGKMMKQQTEFAMRKEFLYKDSEFKKPYRGGSYQNMELNWPVTHWDPPGFDVPANFPATRSSGYPGLPGDGLGGLNDLTCSTIGFTTGSMLDDEEQTIWWENSADMLALVAESGVKIQTATGTVFIGDRLSPNIKWSVDNSDVSIAKTNKIDRVVIDPTGTGANYEVVVSLEVNGEPCDKETITVRCAGGSWVSQSTDDQSDPSDCSKYANTKWCTDPQVIIITSGIYQYRWQVIFGCVQTGFGSGCKADPGLCTAAPNECPDDSSWRAYGYILATYLWVC